MAEPLNETVVERMRADWNARASEDAHYYVAFGRRDQDDDEFQTTGDEIVRALETELRRLPASRPRRARRALEIGCGPGRLLKPMSRHFGEIHGVDISDQMVERARHRLRAIPHAHAHVARHSNLEMFADDSFDFVYSYAVFQHIPSRAVVLGYLRDAWRVLREGGLIRCQINGLPESAARYDTWSGVRISAAEVAQFCLEENFQLLTLEGVSTQYMWTTLRKRSAAWFSALEAPTRPIAIRRITNAQNSEPVAPARGRYAALALWVEDLPEECDLLRFEIHVAGAPATLTYIGPKEHDGLTQVNLRLPAGVPTGLQPVQMAWRGVPFGAPSKVRIIPPPPGVPRLVSWSDGVNLLSGPRIETRMVKVTLEEVADPAEVSALVGGSAVTEIESFCTDPLQPRYELNFRLPENVGIGAHLLELNVGHRRIGAVPLEVVTVS